MKMMDTSQYTVAECYNKGAAKTDAKWTTAISALSAPPGEIDLFCYVAHPWGEIQPSTSGRSY